MQTYLGIYYTANFNKDIDASIDLNETGPMI